MILLTGGSGLLGRELQKHLECYAPTRREMDITKPQTMGGAVNMVIHAAAYTDVAGAEKNRKDCFETNVVGTINLLKAFPTTSFIYISSEYAHQPVNYYAETKRAGEMAVEAYAEKYLIIRTLFKPNPFPYDKAFFDQYTQGDYVDVIAPLIIDAIRNNPPGKKTVYVGTGRKTILELAMKTKPLIPACSVKGVEGVVLPTDYE